MAVGEDPDHVGPAPDFLVEPFLGIVGTDLGPMLDREGAEGQDVIGGVQDI